MGNVKYSFLSLTSLLEKGENQACFTNNVEVQQE